MFLTGLPVKRYADCDIGVLRLDGPVVEGLDFENLELSRPQWFGNAKFGFRYRTVGESGIGADLPDGIGGTLGQEGIRGFEDTLCGAGIP